MASTGGKDMKEREKRKKKECGNNRSRNQIMQKQPSSQDDTARFPTGCKVGDEGPPQD